MWDARGAGMFSNFGTCSLHTLQWRLCKERDVGVSLCPLAILAAFEEIVVRRVARKDVIPYEGIVAPPTVIVASDGALRDQIVRGSVPTHSTEGDRVAVVAEGVANHPMFVCRCNTGGRAHAPRASQIDARPMNHYKQEQLAITIFSCDVFRLQRRQGYLMHLPIVFCWEHPLTPGIRPYARCHYHARRAYYGCAQAYYGVKGILWWVVVRAY